VTFAQGALLEPLSVVMHGISHTRLALGRGVLICGAGPIGLIALAAARASGAHPIVITDLEPRRLAFAREFVPSCHTYQINRSLDAKGNAKAIRSLFGKTEYEAPDTILECTGVESSIITAAYTVRRGGDLMVIGVGRDIMNNLPFMHISLAEVRERSINLFIDDANLGFLDQSEVHQQICRYLASWDQCPIGRCSQSRQVGHTYLPARRSYFGNGIVL
jgi:L-iditol 2-dehydrogenase